MSEGTGQGELSQDKRQASLKTPLGKDKLVVHRLDASEGLSELFDFRVDAISKEPNIDFDKLLGANSVVSINSAHEGVKRHFNAVVTKGRWIGSAAGLHTYRLQLRPWLWLLTRTCNCRIFNNKTVVDIIKDVFSKYDFAKFESKLTQNYPVMEYCVQYRESDFDFVSRLMEEFGIYYFFEHSEDEHNLILADALSCHQPKAGGANLSYFSSYATALQGTGKEDLLHEWTPSRSLRTGKFSQNSFDYAKPHADLLGDKESGAAYANSKLEHYDFHWRHLEKSHGKDFSNVLLEAEQARDKIFSAIGNAVSCLPGALMQLSKHPEKSFNAEYLIARAEHSYRAGDYIAESSGGEKYEGTYEFQPSNIPFRARESIEKPLIYGPQTAIVADDNVDDQGRIKVIFHWERDKNLSRYVRISQGWSGNQWGDIKIPRKDMEVVVEFLDGDPDYPLVTGCVYNGANKAPYPLPQDKTISGTKSQTYEGTGYNELIMDDRDGSELVRMHAQKDMEAKIENNESRKIGNNESRTVGNNVSIDVGNSRIEQIGTSWQVTAGTQIQFNCGASSIILTPIGIIISAPTITLDATATLTANSGTATIVASEGVTMVNSTTMTMVASETLTMVLNAIVVPPMI